MKFSTIICKGCVHKVNILILLICVEMAQSEIQSTIFASRQSITQNELKRSHGSVTSVVRATSKWEKANRLTPLTTPTPLNRQSRNTAHVIMSTIPPHMRHLVKIAPEVTSPHIAKVTTHFVISFFVVRKIFLPT